MNQKTTARIHLLPAKEAPYVVIIRRKPSKTYHIIRWNIETDKFEHGSWFSKHIYVDCCDVSFDGKWMVYLARGAQGTTWNGVCLLPYLKTYLESEAPDTWGGGGYWKDKRTLVTASWTAIKGTVPFKIEDMATVGIEDRTEGGIQQQRMKRDGWMHNKSEKIWAWQFEPRGITLEARYCRYFTDFKYSVRECPELLDEEVESVTFTSNGDLVFSRLGWVYRYARKKIGRGKPAFAADLNELAREQTQVRT